MGGYGRDSVPLLGTLHAVVSFSYCCVVIEIFNLAKFIVLVINHCKDLWKYHTSLKQQCSKLKLEEFHSWTE